VSLVEETWTSAPADSFCHHALFYAGTAELLDAVERFVRAGLEADETSLVVLSGPKVAALRGALGRDGDSVHFADMDEVGANPALIIPLWRDFVQSLTPGRRGRGVGEPVSPDRGRKELVECQIHESLLNVAFADQPLWLLCPYDTASLGASILDEARRSHPFVGSPGQGTQPSERYPGLHAMSAPRPGRIVAPAGAERFTVDSSSMARARLILARRARALGLGDAVAGDFALAAHEVIANSVRHGGGSGDVAIWQEDDALVCEVHDSGVFDEPLAGRVRPAQERTSGRGLWMANQLCDLVQIRSVPGGTVVRLQIRRRPPCD
jgi:anti-sigma regulatory factor (Ser/Thr protein kinase)